MSLYSCGASSGLVHGVKGIYVSGINN